MEVILAILLLFGAYSLGAAGHHGEGERPPMAANPADPSNSEATPAAGHEVKSAEPVDLLDCAADRHYVIYKDLTHSEVRKDEADTTPSDECEGTCRDE